MDKKYSLVISRLKSSHLAKALVLICVFGLLGHGLQAQEVETRKSPIIDHSGFTNVEIIGKYNNRVYLNQWSSERYEMSSIDSNMTKVRYRNFKLPNREQSLNLSFHRDTLYWFLVEHFAGKETLKCLRFDLDFKIIDTLNLYTGTYRFRSHGFTTLKERDKPNLLAFIRKENNESYRTFLINFGDSLNIKENLVSFDTFNNSDFDLYGTLGQNGKVFLGLASHTLNMKKRITEWQLCDAFDAEGLIYKVRMNEMLSSSADIVFDPIKNNLVVGGYYSLQSRDIVNGLYRIVLNLENGAWKSHHSPFKTETVRAMTQHNRRLKNKLFIPHLKLRKLILRSDGGLVYLGEEEQIVTNTRGFSMTGVPLRADLSYLIDDVLIQSMGPEFDSDWTQEVFKTQESKDDDAIYSSFFLMISQSKIQLLVNDEVKRQNTISQYSIVPDGSMTRQHFLPKSISWPSISFRLSYQYDANQIYTLDFIKGRKFRLLEINM